MATINLATGGPLQWIVDDATGLAAVVVNQNEIGKMAFKEDTKDVWMAKAPGSGASNWKMVGGKHRTDVTVVTLTDGASIAWDMSQGNVYQVTLGGNRTLAAPTNSVIGEVYWLKVLQDGTGSRTLAYNAVYHAAGGAITVTATAAHWDWLMVVPMASNIFLTYQIADVSALA